MGRLGSPPSPPFPTVWTLPFIISNPLALSPSSLSFRINLCKLKRDPFPHCSGLQQPKSFLMSTGLIAWVFGFFGFFLGATCE